MTATVGTFTVECPNCGTELHITLLARLTEGHRGGIGLTLSLDTDQLDRHVRQAHPR